jgi:hypothetical protein
MSGCKHSGVRVQSPLTVIEVDAASDNEMKLSDFFKDFRIVRLETNDSVLLDEIQSIVQANDKIYVSDVRALYIFDKTGKFLSSINKKGQGPGEYTGISGFTVDGENIVIMSRTLKKIIVYRESGELVAEYKVDCYAQDISLLGEHNYVLYCGNDRADSRDKIHIINSGKEEKQFMPIDEGRAKYLHYVSPYNFSVGGGDKLRFFEPYNDTVYTVTGDTIEPAFYIDFKGRNIPPSFFAIKHKDIRAFAESVMEHDYAAGVFRFAENENTKMFVSNYKWSNVKLTFFDMRNKTSQTFASIRDDVFFNSLIVPVNEFPYLAGENIIFPVNAITVTDWREKYQPAEQYKETLNAVDEDDNPVLFIFDLK